MNKLNLSQEESYIEPGNKSTVNLPKTKVKYGISGLFPPGYTSVQRKNNVTKNKNAVAVK
jgi:hypothetical protein